LVDKQVEGQTACRDRTERQLQSRQLRRLRGESRSTAAEPVAVEAKVNQYARRSVHRGKSRLIVFRATVISHCAGGGEFI
jgi:hypothetical protein